MTAFTPYKYLFLNLRTCIGTNCFVSECSIYSLSLPCMRLDHDSCQVIKFVNMRTTCSVVIQNMGLIGDNHDLLQPKQHVSWHLTYSRSVKNNACKIVSLEVMNFEYLYSTYWSVFIIGLNIICTKFWSLWNCTRHKSYLYTIWTRNTTRSKWWYTLIASRHWVSFISIRPLRHLVKPS